MITDLSKAYPNLPPLEEQREEMQDPTYRSPQDIKAEQDRLIVAMRVIMRLLGQRKAADGVAREALWKAVGREMPGMSYKDFVSTFDAALDRLTMDNAIEVAVVPQYDGDRKVGDLMICSLIAKPSSRKSSSRPRRDDRVARRAPAASLRFA